MAVDSERNAMVVELWRKKKKITGVRAIPVSDPIPEERRHRTDLGTKIKSDSVIIQVETDEGLVGLGASLGSPHPDWSGRS